MMNVPLKTADPEIFDLIEHEKHRQWIGLELIASENLTSQAVMEANGSCLTNKYSEGRPGARYYGGNEFIDSVERLCEKRALEAFKLDPAKWGVNVQPYSGSIANFSAFGAILKPGDRLMGLDLPHGGHLTHGYATATKKISSTSVYFQSMPYRVVPETGIIDYDRLEENAKLFHPNVIIAGGSAYVRDWDYARFRAIADQENAYFLMDMAHISGLVATGEQSDPFEWADIVTTTTHKTLRGPRAGLIFYRRTPTGDEANEKSKKKLINLEERINFSVFPSTQGGPHNNTIAAVAVALKQAATPEFKLYSAQVRKNAKSLASELMELGYTLVTGGTDNHCILWDLRPQSITGSKIEALCEAVHIIINKNSVPGDKSAMSPGGVRLGSPALTSRGLIEEDFKKVASFLHRTVQISMKVQRNSGKLLKDFIKAISDDAEVKELRSEVELFSKKFAMPGFDINTMTYRD